MALETLEHFLNHRLAKLLNRYRRERIGAPLPIDLEELAKFAGVLSVEGQEMIPEAVVTVEESGFRIYLQSNYANQPGIRIRQRFSLAHEIAHTFFYEEINGVLKPMRDALRGTKLESACYQAAGLLLVPEEFLREELSKISEPFSVEQVLPLSRMFDVSVEVILRRLVEHGVFDSRQLTPILARAGKIEFALYPPLLKSCVSEPRRGTDFSEWFGKHAVQIETLANGALRRTSREGVVLARSIHIGPEMRLWELKRL